MNKVEILSRALESLEFVIGDADYLLEDEDVICHRVWGDVLSESSFALKVIRDNFKMLIENDQR